MASKLTQLKQEVMALANSAEKLGSQLSPFTQKFSQESQKVVATIGETATGEDKKIVEALNAASQSLQKTINTLQQVKQTGDQWARTH